MAPDEVTDEWYATVAAAIDQGFPVVADSDVPEILPIGIRTYERVA